MYGQEAREEEVQVKRTWTWNAWPPPEIDYMADAADEYIEYYTKRVEKFFGIEKNGKELTERYTVYSACTCYRAEEISRARLFGRPKVEELEFPVLKRNITVSQAQLK